MKHVASFTSVRMRFGDEQLLQFRASHDTFQVIILGAGLDTRPWRLNLGPGVNVIDIDQADMTEFKRARLLAADAQLLPAGAHMNGKPHQFPLRCGAWKGLPLDLTGSWLPTLMQSWPSTGVHSSSALCCLVYKWLPVGFFDPPDLLDRLSTQMQSLLMHSADCVLFVLQPVAYGVAFHIKSSGPHMLRRSADVPSVWVAEGLFYYMDDEAGSTLLRTMASASTPDSMLIMTHLNHALFMASQRFVADRQFPTDEKIQSFYSTWKSGMPEDVNGYLASCGWRVKSQQLMSDIHKVTSLVPAQPLTQCPETALQEYGVTLARWKNTTEMRRKYEPELGTLDYWVVVASPEPVVREI